jgi:hypothetical protein
MEELWTTVDQYKEAFQDSLPLVGLDLDDVKVKERLIEKAQEAISRGVKLKDEELGLEPRSDILI